MQCSPENSNTNKSTVSKEMFPARVNVGKR